MSREQVNLEGEVWKDIANHKGYQVSNLGRVKYIGRNCANPFGRVLLVGMKLKHPGHFSVVIRSNYYSVRRLMYRAFVGDYPDSHVLKYIDGNEFNCTLSNLQLTPRIDPNKPSPELINNSYYIINKGEFQILIDKDDYEILEIKNFLLSKDKRDNNRQIRRVSVKIGKDKNPRPLHRLIMNAKPGQMVDHINRNPLDNRKSNMRFCTPSQNSMNSSPILSSKSKYKGVHPYQNRFKVAIKAHGIVVRLGIYDTEEEAAGIYNTAARLLHKEFAYQNPGIPHRAIMKSKIIEKVTEAYRIITPE